MICQEMPRKGHDYSYPENKGFFVEGKDWEDCKKQLLEWCDKNLDKWVYCHDCGVGVAKRFPVARHVFEVMIFDKEPAAKPLLCRKVQEGSEKLREIDEMTEEEKKELAEKRMHFFWMLGWCYGRNTF